jgi:membrane protein
MLTEWPRRGTGRRAAIVRAVDPSDPTPDPGPAERRLRDRARDARRQATEARDRAERSIRSGGSRRWWLGVLVETYDRDRRRAGALLSGGLAFRFFLWLLPFALVVVSGMGFLADRLDRPIEQLAHDAGLSAAIAGTVEEGVRQSARGGVALFAIGVVLVVWAAGSIVRALGVVSTVAWELPPHAMPGRLAASLWFTVFAAALIALHVVAGPLYAGGLATDLLATLGLIAADMAFVYVIFRRLPNRVAGWRVFVPGALVFAIGLEIMRLVTAVYFAGKLGRVDDLYGSLGLATVILAWLFLIGRFTVAGLMLSASIGARLDPPTDTSE